MNTETVATITVNTILIPSDYRCSLDNIMGSAIRCISINEQGFRFRKINLVRNGEEFFLTRQALENSLWILPPNNAQLRFI